jgi:hypothetical protein
VLLNCIYVFLYRFDQDGTRVSVVQYFKCQYDYSLKYIHWPCLQAGSDSRPVYLPMEVASHFLVLYPFIFTAQGILIFVLISVIMLFVNNAHD